jgi:hypothetical protein
MNLRRGFWRLSAIVWAFGAGLLFVWSDEVLRNPFEQVCRVEVEPPYDECLSEQSRRLSESGSITEQLLGRLRGEWREIDPARSARRWVTVRYRTASWNLARRQAIWAAGVWGAYYLLVWIGSGFRARRAEPD